MTGRKAGQSWSDLYHGKVVVRGEAVSETEHATLLPRQAEKA